jgi:hypothetical protein
MNCNKFNSNCLLKEGLLARKNFGFLKTHKSGCTLHAIHFTIMAKGHKRFSVIEEISSHAFCKIAAPVSPRRVIRNYQSYRTIPYLPILLSTNQQVIPAINTTEAHAQDTHDRD